MMLTMVAFQFIVETKMPSISYLTTLDIYMVFSMGFIFVVALTVTGNAVFTDPDNHTTADRLCALGLFGFFVVVNIIFFIKLFIDRRFELKKLKFTSKDYEDEGDDEEDDDDGFYEICLSDKGKVYCDQTTRNALNKELWEDIDWDAYAIEDAENAKNDKDAENSDSK